MKRYTFRVPLALYFEIVTNSERDAREQAQTVLDYLPGYESPLEYVDTVTIQINDNDDIVHDIHGEIQFRRFKGRFPRADLVKSVALDPSDGIELSNIRAPKE